MQRDGLSVCTKETGENASNEGKTETTNVHQKEDLDCQICHEETLKAENAAAKENKTSHDIQRGQDLPLRADGTSNISDANCSIFGSNFVKISLEETRINDDALFGEMNGKTLEDLCLY